MSRSGDGEAASGAAGNAEARPLLKAADVAKRCSISLSAAYNLMSRLGPVKIGSGVRLEPQVLDAYVRSGGDLGEEREGLVRSAARRHRRAARPRKPRPRRSRKKCPLERRADALDALAGDVMTPGDRA